MTSTELRKSLFRVLKEAIPTRVTYPSGNAVILSYEFYQKLLKQEKSKKKAGLWSLIDGEIYGSLDEKADEELMKYLGFK